MAVHIIHSTSRYRQIGHGYPVLLFSVIPPAPSPREGKVVAIEEGQRHSLLTFFLFVPSLPATIIAIPVGSVRSRKL